MGLDAITTAIITSAISATISAIVASIIARGRKATSRQEAMDAGMRALLKAELYAIWHDYAIAGEPMPMYVRDIASSCYRVYHDELGGNGTGTAMYEAIMRAEIKGDD